MTIPSPYDEIAGYYDLEHQSFTDDVDLFLQFVEAAGDPVLELGCGTGRIVREIAAAGYRVTGVDASAEMLAIARDMVTADQVDEQVTLVESDFERLVGIPDETFGVAILALDSLLHATSLSAQRRVLECAWRALDPRGQLIVDVFHPTPARLLAMDGGLTFAGSWTSEDGSRVDKLIAQSADHGQQLVHTEVWYEITAPDRSVRRARSAFDQRWIGSGELLLMLQLAGFQDWRIYGSYELDPLDAHSDRLIVAAEKMKTD